MAPIQESQQDQADVEQNNALIIDWHMSAPREIDLQQEHPLLREFHEYCAIKNMGTRLRTIEKKYNLQNRYIGFLECSSPLPENFIGRWCRLFYRAGHTFVFVLSQNNKDFIIVDFQHGTSEVFWTLVDAIPDDAFLQSVETQPGDETFRIIYTQDGNEFISIEYGFGFPIPVEAEAVH